jgi:hypothetical protein
MEFRRWNSASIFGGAVACSSTIYDDTTDNSITKLLVKYPPMALITKVPNKMKKFTPKKSSPLFLSTATNFYFQSIGNSGVGTLPAFRDAIVVEDEGHLKSSLNYY